MRGLFEALLPFLFKKEKTVAEDSVPAPADLRRSWADRVTERMRELESDGGDSSAD
tara:strand:+ start:676 stop:843 length:168 start_codon:yes stop_codon:yes gene_type:complete